MTQQQFEDLVIDLIEAIYISTEIPESHKERYVEHIEKNGLTEKMISELLNIFQKEQLHIDGELGSRSDLINGLRELIKEEQAMIQEDQTAIVASIDNYAVKKKQEFSQKLQDIETDLVSIVEEMGNEKEKNEEESIRAKLQQK